MVGDGEDTDGAVGVGAAVGGGAGIKKENIVDDFGEVLVGMAIEDGIDVFWKFVPDSFADAFGGAETVDHGDFESG